MSDAKDRLGNGFDISRKGSISKLESRKGNNDSLRRSQLPADTSRENMIKQESRKVTRRGSMDSQNSDFRSGLTVKNVVDAKLVEVIIPRRINKAIKKSLEEQARVGVKTNDFVTGQLGKTGKNWGKIQNSNVHTISNSEETVVRIGIEMFDLGQALINMKNEVDQNLLDAVLLERERTDVMAEITNMEKGIDSMAREMRSIVKQSDVIIQQVFNEDKKAASLTGEARAIKDRLDGARTWWKQNPDKARSRDIQDMKEAGKVGRLLDQAMTSNRASKSSIAHALAPVHKVIDTIKDVTTPMKTATKLVTNGLVQIGTKIQSLRKSLTATLENVKVVQSAFKGPLYLFDYMKNSNMPLALVMEKSATSMAPYRDTIPDLVESTASLEKMKVQIRKTLQEMKKGVPPMRKQLGRTKVLLVPLEKALAASMVNLLQPLEVNTISRRKELKHISDQMSDIRVDDYTSKKHEAFIPIKGYEGFEKSELYKKRNSTRSTDSRSSVLRTSLLNLDISIEKPVPQMSLNMDSKNIAHSPFNLTPKPSTLEADALSGDTTFGLKSVPSAMVKTKLQKWKPKGASVLKENKTNDMEFAGQTNMILDSHVKSISKSSLDPQLANSKHNSAAISKSSLDPQLANSKHNSAAISKSSLDPQLANSKHNSAAISKSSLDPQLANSKHNSAVLDPQLSKSGRNSAKLDSQLLQRNSIKLDTQEKQKGTGLARSRESLTIFSQNNNNMTETQIFERKIIGNSTRSFTITS